MNQKQLFDTMGDFSLPPADAATVFAVACSVLVFAVLSAIAVRRVHWYLRPSLLIFGAYALRVQWPSIFYLRKVAETAPTPWHYTFIIHGFALLYLVVAIPLLMAGDRRMRATWARMRRQIESKQVWPGHLTAILLTVTLLTMLWYFLTIPFTETGLYYLFTSPTELTAAREASWKLLPSETLIYLYSWNYNTFAPMLLAGATVMLLQRGRLDYLLFGSLAALSTFLSANRGGVAQAVLVVLVTYFLLRAKRIRMLRTALYIALCGALVSLGPAYISLKREGRELTPAAYAERINSILFGRSILGPAHTVKMYVYHTQVSEYRGLAGIRPLAILAGTPYENVSNEIGRQYVSGGGPTTICNTNFVGAYYILFGLFTVPLCVAGVLLFDLFALVFRIQNLTVLPFFVLFILKALLLSEGVFTTGLITGGLWLIPLLALVARQREKTTSGEVFRAGPRPRAIPGTSEPRQTT